MARRPRAHAGGVDGLHPPRRPPPALGRRPRRTSWPSTRSGEADLEDALRIDLLCSGTHRILAEELAVEAAAAAAARFLPAFPVFPAFDAWPRSATGPGSFASTPWRPRRSRAKSSSNQMEWIRVDCQAIGFAEEGPAREAALLLREDELDIAEVAGEADVPIEEVVLYLDELDARAAFPLARRDRR